jgi:hypothetical protein
MLIIASDPKHGGCMTTVYIRLLHENVDVWRPVEATPLGTALYLLPEAAPPDEVWAFTPGSVVRCTERDLDGGVVLVAAESISDAARGAAPESGRSPDDSAVMVIDDVFRLRMAGRSSLASSPAARRSSIAAIGISCWTANHPNGVHRG